MNFVASHWLAFSLAFMAASLVVGCAVGRFIKAGGGDFGDDDIY